MTSHRIHVLGLGKMGLPMASLLQKAGYRCTGSDSSEVRRVLARSQGIQVVEESRVNPSFAQSAMTQAEILVSSLPDDTALLGVTEQLCAFATRGAAWIDTSTVSAQASALAAEKCERAGVRYCGRPSQATTT
jgi:3-hydroxyisobutyrate dehydrogenase-like beta-hydroxyacid dehydrogenase